MTVIVDIFAAIVAFFIDQLPGLALGIVGSIVADQITVYIFFTKSLRRTERMIFRSISYTRLRRLHKGNDPYSIIRTEWAIALRDLGSTKQAVVDAALESLYHMADILEEDERDVAREGLRLRIAYNKHRESDAKFLRVMTKLS